MNNRGKKYILAIALIGALGFDVFSAILPPEFISSASGTNAALSFTFQATPGSGYSIEASTNFAVWVFYSSLLGAQDTESFVFPSAGFTSCSFFRLREFGPALND